MTKALPKQKKKEAGIDELARMYDYRKVIARIENLELKAFGSVQES